MIWSREAHLAGHTMWSPELLMLAAALVSGDTVMGVGKHSECVRWPLEYNLNGTRIDLVVVNIEHFEIWYSSELQASRISYFEGTDSEYYYGSSSEGSGRMFKVYPMASENLDVYETCTEEPYEGDALDFLPSVEGLKYSGEIIFNDKEVTVWRKHDTSDEDLTEEVLLYVYKENAFFDIPVRYEVKGYNTWTKALTRHQIVEYHSFQYPNSSALDASSVEACTDANIGTDLEKALRAHHPDSKPGLKKAFHAYKQHHRRKYNDEEHEMRLTIFENNWRKVIAHNNKNLTYKMAINQFSDRTPQELTHLTGTTSNPLGKGSVEFPHSELELQVMMKDLPENYNMRLDGVINNVKHQGRCGSCWAFSTTAAVEGALARSNGGRLLDLSEQSLIDCAWGFSNSGCAGGMLDTAFRYILKYGIPTQEEYGMYLGQDGRCVELSMSEVFKIKGFARVPPRSANAMKAALYKYGPVAIAFYVTPNFRQYSNGIFFDNDCVDASPNEINHGMTVVGYGVRDGDLYWIVKNSWGEDWGQDGYVYVSAKDDNCFLLTEAYYPIV